MVPPLAGGYYPGKVVLGIVLIWPFKLPASPHARSRAGEVYLTPVGVCTGVTPHSPSARLLAARRNVGAALALADARDESSLGTLVCDLM